MFSNLFASSGSNNIIVPLTILEISATSRGADIQFLVDLKKQYYINAQIRFKYRNASALRFQGVPIQTALRMSADGTWREVYDQDQRFQTIGQVIHNPQWQVDLQDVHRLEKATVTAAIEKQFLSFVSSVKNRYLDAHDIVLELTGSSYVREGFPKTENGMVVYGPVDFDLSKFDAIYIVPKGGPSGSAIVS